MSQLAWAVAGSATVALAAVTAYALSLRARLGQAAAQATTADARTAEQALEERTRERELLLRTLLDASPLAIVCYADAGRILFANSPASRLFFEDQPAEGKNFLRLVSTGPVAFRHALLGASDEIASFDIEGQRETYNFVRRTFPFNGEPHTLLVVRHITREVTRHELDVLKRVVRLLSHEVNNSLAPVSSLVHSARQIIKTGERIDRLERVFTTIDERTKHLAQFIASYAALARLPKPAPRELEWEPVLARLRAMYPEARLTAAEGARGYFDPAQLEQALINLLKNGSEAGGPADAVELHVQALEDGATELLVLDRGLGFSGEALENAVLPFFTTKPGGSGVGLALVREVVDAHAGQLVLGARADGGAVVTVRLPGAKKQGQTGESLARLTLTRA
jgi:two-component system nitrogen regulation sensor histidine kinase NtrY